MSDTERLTDRAHWPDLAALLSGWVPIQRWFQGKARRLVDVNVEDAFVLEGDPPVTTVLCNVAYHRGSPERYQVPLTAGPGFGDVAGVAVTDALAVPECARTIARAALSDATVATAAGDMVHGAPVADAPSPPAAARPLGAEQSNTSVVFDDSLLLKVFRKLEVGVNPEVELTRGLTEAGFPHVPPQAGALLLDGAGGPCALAVLSTFRSGAKDAWVVACAEAAAARRSEAPPPLDGEAAALGSIVAELHRTLGERFGERQATLEDAGAWVRDMHAQLDEVLVTLEEHPVQAAADITQVVDTIRTRFEQLLALGDAGRVLRTHGDLHLGQVLLDATHGWQILDFEGEPARPLAERRQPHSPIRDVAGMLRSFDYAAAHGAPADEAAPPPEVARWRSQGRAAFLEAYLAAAGDAGLLPSTSQAQQALIDAFELDKAVYELGYELANRPGWVRIPVGGILRLVEQGTVPSSMDR